MNVEINVTDGHSDLNKTLQNMSREIQRRFPTCGVQIVEEVSERSADSLVEEGNL